MDRTITYCLYMRDHHWLEIQGLLEKFLRHLAKFLQNLLHYFLTHLSEASN